jgi:transposase
VVERLRHLPESFEVCYEASCGYGWLYDQLKPIAARVVVAHPGQLRLIFRSKRKNDRADAQKLAKLLFLGEVPPVYVPSPETRAWRALVEHRQRCVAERTRGKNGIRAVLRTHGIEVPKRTGLWSARGLLWLEKLEFSTAGSALQRDQLVDDVRHHARKVSRVEKVLRDTSERHPGVELLRTIPGVGIRTAEAFVVYIDDAGRFGSTKAIGRYLGLVPCQDASAGINRLGRITKEGPATLRKLLTEAAWQGVLRSPTIRAYHERMKHGRDDRNKKALIATAHYLARVMLAMLTTGEAWRESVGTDDAALPGSVGPDAADDVPVAPQPA